jgi:hypothetical protein
MLVFNTPGNVSVEILHLKRMSSEMTQSVTKNVLQIPLKLVEVLGE